MNLGIDNTLLNKAKAANQGITYLDDMNSVAAGFEEGMGAADLDQLLKYPDPVAHLYTCSMMAKNFYLSGQGERFQEYNKSCETEASLNRLQKRTVSWVPKVEKLLKEGNAFIVFGADHMNGPNGMEALLESKGYKVTRVGSESAPVQTKPVFGLVNQEGTK